MINNIIYIITRIILSALAARKSQSHYPIHQTIPVELDLSSTPFVFARYVLLIL